MSSSDWIAVAGVAANLMVVVVAIFIPMLQRKASLRDAKAAEEFAWDRFVEAFGSLTIALDAVAEAGKMSPSTEAFREAEIELHAALEALAASSAVVLPVKAVLNAGKAQQKAAALLVHFPNLIGYGTNLLAFNHLQNQFDDASGTVHSLLVQTRRLKDLRD